VFDPFTVAIVLVAFVAALIDTSLGMCYGTILSPSLVIAGYSPEVVVPTVLLSQLVVDLVGGANHIKFRNFTSRDVRIVWFVVISAVIFVFLGVFLNVSLPKVVTKMYIGLVVILLGLLLLLGIKVEKTSKRLVFISSLAGFNKGFMGGGFGPVVVSGQIVLNHDVRSSVSVANISEIPVCVVGLLTFAMLGKLSFLPIYVIVTVPAMIASFVGPRITAIVGRKEYAEKVIGGLVFVLGFITLIKVIGG